MTPSPARSNAAPALGAPVATAAPTPADKAPTAGPQAGSPRFAELLRRNRAEAPPPPATPIATPSPPDEPAEGTDAQAPSSIESKAVAGNAAKARAATPKRATGMAVVESSEHKSEKAQGEVAGDEIDLASTAAQAPPTRDIDARTLATATLANPQRTSPSADDADDPRAPRRSGATGSPAAMQSGASHARGMANVDAADDRRATSVEASRDIALLVGADPGFHAAVAESTQLPGTAGAPSPADRAIDALTASLAAAATTRSAAEAAPPSTTVATLALSTPIDAPDFAATLGVQVSVLANDGVQQAELHLNPAEMGPVSIHISLEGTAARVDFGADAAATREAIERGLPELASALRDAGFTLAGGGVSQHAGGRSSGEGEAARAGRRLDAGGPAAATGGAASAGRVVRTVPAGGVDLYA
ncbi:MAG: flagellar hook-length control protein FliK [Caldimonas sp.]